MKKTAKAKKLCSEWLKSNRPEIHEKLGDTDLSVEFTDDRIIVTSIVKLYTYEIYIFGLDSELTKILYIYYSGDAGRYEIDP